MPAWKTKAVGAAFASVEHTTFVSASITTLPLGFPRSREFGAPREDTLRMRGKGGGAAGSRTTLAGKVPKLPLAKDNEALLPFARFSGRLVEPSLKIVTPLQYLPLADGACQGSPTRAPLKPQKKTQKNGRMLTCAEFGPEYR